MRGAVACPDEIVVAELAVFAAAAVVVAPAAFAAAADFEGTQSFLCSDHSLAAQLAGLTAGIGIASAVEQDFHTEDLTHHSNFESVGLPGEKMSASNDPHL